MKIDTKESGESIKIYHVICWKPSHFNNEMLVCGYYDKWKAEDYILKELGTDFSHKSNGVYYAVKGCDICYRIAIVYVHKRTHEDLTKRETMLYDLSCLIIKHKRLRSLENAGTDLAIQNELGQIANEIIILKDYLDFWESNLDFNEYLL